jgi:hypothetical protein
MPSDGGRSPQKRVHEQTATHPDLPVDPPYGKLDPCLFQGFAPGQNMLVHAVHQRAVEVEQESRRGDSIGWVTRAVEH